MVVLTKEAYIRNLPHKAYVKLSSMLDPGGLWERMAAKIPLKLGDVEQADAQPRYTHQQIAVFAYMAQRPGQKNSPTERIIVDWGTKNARIGHLIAVLLRADFYAAANYLHHDLLQLDLIPHPLDPSEKGDDSLIADPSGSSNNPRDQLSPGGGTETSNGDVCKEGLSQTPDVCKEEPLQSPGVCQEGLLQSSDVYDGFAGMSSELGTISDHMSHFSRPGDSLLAEQGVLLSQLQRQSSVPHPDSEAAWIGLTDIEIQTISYNMLSAVTDKFNMEPLNKGGNLIGSGGFGKVFLGNFQNGFKIAVKYLVQPDHMKPEDLQWLNRQFETEVKVLSTYRHENVVHLLGYSIDGPSQCLVYQYMANGSLEDRLARLHDTPPLSANMRLKIIVGTARGIQFLNQQGYVHRDIKSANILLDSEYMAKIGDFATVACAPSGDSKTIAKVSMVIGSAAYLAPEANSFEISTKLDSYAFGVVLLEAITGLPALDPGREDGALSSHIMENVEEAAEIHDYVDQSAGAWPEGAVETLYHISIRCFTTSKKRRPNVKDFLPELENL